jgi:uncharacterized protein
MPELEKRIENDLRQAQKNKDENRISALRLLRAAIEQEFIQKGKKELKDEDVISIIKKETKKIKDSIEAFKKGKRDDLIKKEESDLNTLKDYLPPEVSEDEIKKQIKEAIDEAKPESKKDFGKVMGLVMSKIGGGAEGKKVAALLHQELSKIEKE